MSSSASGNRDWRAELDSFFDQKTQTEQRRDSAIGQSFERAMQWLKEVALPALQQLKPELEKHGRSVQINGPVAMGTGPYVGIIVNFQGREELSYRVVAHAGETSVRAFPEITFMSEGRRYRSEGYFRSGAQDYDARTVSADEIISDFLQHYRDQLSYLSRQR